MLGLLSDYLSDHKGEFVSRTVIGLFQQASRWYPDKDAVCLDSTHITYSMLDRSSDQLAHYLTEYEHIGPGDIVAVVTGRNMDTPAIVLGIWKTGAAYMILDRCCPESHNKNCIRSVNARICIDHDYFINAISSCGQCFAFEDRSRSHQLALVLFTSGSTGKPKGVRILHSNLAASVSNFDCLPLRSDDTFASFAKLLFIAAVYDFCSCLSLGCTFRMVPSSICKNIQALAAFYIQNNITATFLPPHMATKYIEIDQGSTLRLLLVGSEVTRNLKKRPYEIVNIYASSEAIAAISHYNIQDARSSYPIGKLVPALKGYVMTEDGTPASIGQNGELWISGAQICDGYLNLPEVNMDRFAPNPFETAPPFQRVFKTCDIVRILPDGNMEYIGRKDNMFKIRGFRVEPSGVERYMLEFPHISEACVTCFTDNGGTSILFGYFIADEKIDHKALRTFLQERIPYYTIPTGFIQTDTFPRTLSGKVDRHGFLPPPELDDHKKLAVLYY